MCVAINNLSSNFSKINHGNSQNGSFPHDLPAAITVWVCIIRLDIIGPINLSFQSHAIDLTIMINHARLTFHQNNMKQPSATYFTLLGSISLYFIMFFDTMEST